MQTKVMRRVAPLAIVLGAVVMMGSSCDESAANSKDRAVANKQLTEFQTNQPVPTFNWSQLRQNLIEIETAQARTTQTTTFFFNQGVQDPVSSCPSIGFPIPATYQLTNPEAKLANHDLTVPQIESTGVYTADTAATYVICIDAQGRTYADYWEGFVKTVTGPAKWDAPAHAVVLTGPPSFQFTKGK